MANPGLGLGHMGHLGYTGPPWPPIQQLGPVLGNAASNGYANQAALYGGGYTAYNGYGHFSHLDEISWNFVGWIMVSWNPKMGTVKKACSAWKPSLSGLLVLGLCHNIHCFYRVTQLPISQVLVPFEASILGGSDEGPLLSSPPIYDRFKW